MRCWYYRICAKVSNKAHADTSSEATALNFAVSFHLCSPEPSVFADAISTKFSCAGHILGQKRNAAYNN